MIAQRKTGSGFPKAPMHVRMARMLEETFHAVKFDLLLCAGGTLAGGELRASVADFIDTHGDDREAAACFRQLPAKVRDEMLRTAMPAQRYSL